GVLVALEKRLELGILAALDEARHLEVLRQALGHLLRLRRERVDAGLGQVPAVVVAPGEVVPAHHERDEEERVDERAGAVTRRALPEDATEVLEGEAEVGEDEPS